MEAKENSKDMLVDISKSECEFIGDSNIVIKY